MRPINADLKWIQPFWPQPRKGVIAMAKKEMQPQLNLPMLKTVEQMSKISGIGDNKLRELMDNGELEYIQN